jgi:uncharacterized iron-regulated protein
MEPAHLKTEEPTHLKIEGLEKPLTVGSIYDTAQKKSIRFDELIEQLAAARVVYVGEQHTSSAHHQAQLDIIRTLVESGRKICVGMEMFDHTYQDRLDQWSAGDVEWDVFLKRSHWYANWRFDDALYKEILFYVKQKHLKLVGLNIPFHLPRKISVGGLDSLRASERKQLPQKIDTADAEHRAYVEKIFKMHNIHGRQEFDNFYAAQCSWEDGMAQAVADNLGNDTMVVIAGNGHIVRKFGIPNRAFKRSQAPFRTIYMATAGATPGAPISLDAGDFIWVTEPSAHR